MVRLVFVIRLMKVIVLSCWGCGLVWRSCMCCWFFSICWCVLVVVCCFLCLCCCSNVLKVCWLFRLGF